MTTQTPTLFVLPAVLVAFSLLSCHPKDPNRLTCIFLGKDSVAYYYGDSAVSDQVHRGKADDPRFLTGIVGPAYVYSKKNPGFTIFLKPSAGDGSLQNLCDFKTSLQKQGLNATIIDTLNQKEIAFFHAPPLTNIFNAEPTNTLQLPADTEGTDSFPNNPARLVVLIYDENGLFAYRGTDLANGKKYTYSGFRTVLRSLNTDGKLSVLIRPSKKCTYRNTVNMLDMMTIGKVKHYSLVDITRREESFLGQSLRTDGVSM